MTEDVFQSRVGEWLAACFPPSARKDLAERTYRFLEEAIELAQSTGCSEQDAHRLVEYVFSRGVGCPDQEVGGVMVTLAGLCVAAGIDMDDAADRELERNWSRIDAIRQKQAKRPTDSPLPQ